MSRNIIDFADGLRRTDALLSEWTSGLLMNVDFGGDVELAHGISLDRVADSVLVELRHTFTIPLDADCNEVDEVRVVAVLSLADAGCAGRIAVEAHLDRTVGDLSEGRTVLAEQRAEAADPMRVILFLCDEGIRTGPLVEAVEGFAERRRRCGGR